MSEPNLFDYATSELSQDAALCWLLAWADPSCGSIDPELHATGRAFLELLYRLSTNDAARGLAPRAAVRVETQVDHADVVALVGDEDLVVIEDKVDTSQHDGQLARYVALLSKRYPGRRIVAVYLKSGDQASYDDAKTAGWGVCRRKDLLSVLVASRATNPILRDFRAHLQAIDDAVEAYAHLPVKSWSKRAWAGFYMALRERLCEGAWGYVANQSGGFMGFWWGWQSVGDGVLYVQLEQEKLVIKLKTGAPGVSPRTWSERVVEHFGASGIARPKRLGIGKHVAVATATSSYLVTRDDDLIDVERTAMALAQIAARLKSVRSTAVSLGAV